MSTSYVIIGDGIAGSTAAETLREHDGDASITVITDEGTPLYNRILIKEFAKGTLPEAPLLMHDRAWYSDRDIDLALNTLVLDVDTDAQTVTVDNGRELAYDHLLIASGGTPRQLPVPNADATGIHHFWTLEDARRIGNRADAADTGAIVGAGLIGIDLAGVCGANDVDAHYLMRGGRWWRYAMSDAGADIIHTGLRELGVTPVFQSQVDHFTVADGEVRGVVTESGTEYPAEFVGVGIGLSPNTEFLADTPIDVDGGIIVDETLQTSVENVYAAGDVARFHDPLTGEYECNGSWDSAKEQGQVAATNMLSETTTEPFRFVSTYSITHFDFPFLSIGHPTRGDRYVERRYGESTWRRIAIRDGAVIGAVLIGDLSPQRSIKELITKQHPVSGAEDALLADSLDLARVAPSSD